MYPLAITLAAGGSKLRDHHAVILEDFDGPDVLSSFEKALSNSIAAKSFRQFLVEEFTFGKSHFLVEIENFKLSLMPTSCGILNSKTAFQASADDGHLFSTSVQRCSRWSQLSGNVAPTNISLGGRMHVRPLWTFSLLCRFCVLSFTIL